MITQDRPKRFMFDLYSLSLSPSALLSSPGGVSSVNSQTSVQEAKEGRIYMTTDSFYRVLFIIGIYFTDSHGNSHIYPQFIKCNADRYKEIPFKLFPFIAVTLYYYCSG